jgi:hypothetical protein
VVIIVEFQAVAASAEEDDWPTGVATSEAELASCMLILPPMVTVVAVDSVTVVTTVVLAVRPAD